MTDGAGGVAVELWAIGPAVCVLVTVGTDRFEITVMVGAVVEHHSCFTDHAAAATFAVDLMRRYEAAAVPPSASA